MKIECRNCGHGAHNGDCAECFNNYRPSCSVFTPDWEALQQQLAFYAGAVTAMRSILGVDNADIKADET